MWGGQRLRPHKLRKGWHGWNIIRELPRVACESVTECAEFYIIFILLRTVCNVIEFYLLLYLWVLLVMCMLNFINLCLSYLLGEGSVCASSWIAVPHRD